MSAAAKDPCLLCRIQGHVQGVSFRANTQTEANRLGVRGYAKNLPGGEVEVLLCGPKAAVDILRDWLARGAPPAQVTAVTCTSVTDNGIAGFRIL